jgi:hypothetical protein
MSCAPAKVGREDPGERSPEPAAELHDQELIMHLEPDQLVAATAEPVAPAPLGARAKALLWGLRIFVVLVSLMVIYTFVDRLH